MSIYSSLLEKSRKGIKQFAVLVDPDKLHSDQVTALATLAAKSAVDYIFIGGSLLTNDCLDSHIQHIKTACNIPVLLFPGNTMQINPKADGILFLSLISGRNPDLLIGSHVVAAPLLKNSGLEIIPTGYILIDGGRPTTASYMSNTTPIPADKPEIAACTALAGEMLGLKLMYLDAGSGANKPVSTNMIKTLKEQTQTPLIVGGGIKSPEQAKALFDAGADLIVVGNAIEKNLALLTQIADSITQTTY